MTKPTRANYRVTFEVTQGVRLNEQRGIIMDLDPERIRWLSPSERAAHQAVDYLLQIAATSQAEDMLYGLVASVKLVEGPE